MKTNTKAIVKHVYISSIHSIFDVGYACNHTKYYLKKNKLGDNGTFLLNEIAEKTISSTMMLIPNNHTSETL